MGIRGEIFSTRVILQNRTYFFNVKENRLGDLYLNIVESKNRETGGFERQSVILFADDLKEFLKGFDESLRVLEKAEREKRKSGKFEGRTEGRGEKIERGEKGERTERPERAERGAEPGRDAGKNSGRSFRKKPGASDSPDRPQRRTGRPVVSARKRSRD